MTQITSPPPPAPIDPKAPGLDSLSLSVQTLSQARRDPEAEYQSRPIDLAIYRRMLSYCKPYRALFGTLLLLAFLRAAQLPFLDKIVATTIGGPITKGTHAELIACLTALVALSAFTQFIFYFRMGLVLRLGENVVHDLRRDIFSQLQRLTMSFYHKTRLGRIISRFTSDADIVRQGIQDAIFVTIVGGGQIIVALGIMAFTDQYLFLVVLATTPFYYLTCQYFRMRLMRAFRANQESFSRVTATFAESVNGVRVTQSFVRQDRNAEMWNHLVVDHARYNMATVRAQAQFSPTLELLGALLSASILMVGGWRILGHGKGDLQSLMTFYFLISNQILGPLSALGNNYTMAMNSMAGAERVFGLLDRTPDFTDPPNAIPLPPIQGHVELRDLTFAYEPGKPVLKNINFHARPGQTIALVGHTGSGKSSIINLISKFYLPTSGLVLIDGLDITTLDADSLHRQMGIVLQNNFLFTGSVMDNIRIGKPTATDQEVRAACANLDCLDMMENLPDGFDSQVGEGGAGLSLGERQLVCFARAMLADPRIMILDEATSAVDTLTEVKLQNALGKLLTGRTSFVVAHRLSTIRHADVVLVLDHGRIVERGTHDALLAEGGPYADLYLQFIQAGES